jgi:hypothetical protein
MPYTVVNGATLMCSFGMAPSTFVVTPVNGVLAENQPVANILDHKPMVNIMPFGMCMSLANPQVAAATTAASGVLTWPENTSRYRLLGCRANVNA